MKRSFCVFLLILLAVFSGCDNSKNTEQIEEIKTISVGETVVTEDFKFRLNEVEFSYDVKPDNQEAFFNHYPAEEGQVYIHIDADIRNRSKEKLLCSEIYTVSAEYANQYIYNGYTIAEDTEGDFSDSAEIALKPKKLRGVHTLITCPQEVEASEESLVLTITMADESQYQYVIN